MLRSNRTRIARLAAVSAVVGCFAVAEPVFAQFDLGGILYVLEQILDTNHQIVTKLDVNNQISLDHYNLDEEISTGFRNPLPEIKRRLTKDFKDDAIGYVEEELAPMHRILRDGRVSADNRKIYEHAFGAVPDTPNAALSQLVVDDAAVFLMTKAGENVKLIEDLRDEYEQLSRETQAYPDRAAELARQQLLVMQKIQTLQAELSAYDAQARAMQVAMMNQYRKDEKKAQLMTVREVTEHMRNKRPMWMRDRSDNGQGAYAAE